MMHRNVVIIGGGISGIMMAARLRMMQPDLSVCIIDSGGEQDHPFHLHRLISEIEELRGLQSVTLKNNIYSEGGFSDKPTILECCNYSKKTLKNLQVTNCNRLADSTIYPIQKKELIGIFRRKSEFDDISGKVVQVDLYNKTLIVESNGIKTEIGYVYLINTISLPIFLKICSINHKIPFSSSPFYTARIELGYDTGCYHIIYNAHKHCNITRLTLLDREIFVEAHSDLYTARDADLLHDLYSVGESHIEIPKLHKIFPGRFNLINHRTRKSLLHFLTQRYDAMCLGRFGAWTFKVANDVWEDTKFLTEIIIAKEMAVVWERQYIT